MKRFMEQIVKNDKLKNRLCSDILSGSFSHAYIIEGAKGSGKHTIARLTAAALACEKKNDPNAPLPCTACESCRKILNFISPDVMTVGTEDKATIGVDAVRAIREDVYTVPNDLDNKIYIIEDADKMTVQAQNAFLLTLEEPPAYVGFLLLCESTEPLLETIRSRAPILRTEPISAKDIDEYITRTDTRARQLKETSQKDYSELIASAENGIGNALSLLEPNALASVLARRRLAKDFVLMSLGKGSRKDALSLLPRFSSKRDELSEDLRLIYTAFRDLIVIKKCESAPLCFYESHEVALEICELAGAARLLELCELVTKANDSISRNANVRLTLISLMSDASLI